MTNKESSLVMSLVQLARRKHYYCEDTWYSCPKHPESSSRDDCGKDCTCGADEVNAKVAAIVAALQREKEGGLTDGK